MNITRVVLCVLASVPAAWFASTLYERVPGRQPLFSPFPPLRLSGVHLTIQTAVTALFAVATLRFVDENPLVLGAYLVFFTVAIALSMIDLDTLRLPDAIVAGALMVSLPLVVIASLAVHDATRIQYALTGGLLYFGFLLAVHLAFPRGMGFGDVKLSALLGLFVGWAATSSLTAVVLVLYAMIAGTLVGSFAGIVLFAFRGKSRHYPFGPFLIGGAVVAIAFSTQLLPLAS